MENPRSVSLRWEGAPFEMLAPRETFEYGDWYVCKPFHDSMLYLLLMLNWKLTRASKVALAKLRVREYGANAKMISTRSKNHEMHNPTWIGTRAESSKFRMIP